MENVIKSIDTGSRMHHHASPGDMVVSINGNPIRDVLDYKFYSYDRRLTIVLRSPEGKERTPTGRKSRCGSKSPRARRSASILRRT